MIRKRSDCPLSSTLELVGDKWSLLIIRDILMFEKKTYNEFLNSPEKIATNILKDRLDKLTDYGIITHENSLKRKKYKLTKMGEDLKPILAEIAIFGMKYFGGDQDKMKKHLNSIL